MMLQACQKEVTPSTADYKIQEYFAPEGTDVKQTIIDFLYAAGRINNVAAKSDNATLTDKDPNEGAWLMEAAINLERYNDFSEATTYKKEFTLEVANKVLPDGIIKMDANDIIAKYSDLLAAIVAEETGGKIAKLIDIRIEYVTAYNTGLSVVALFGGGNNDIGAPWIGNEPSEYSPSFCGFIYPNYPMTYNLSWNEISEYPNQYGLSNVEGTKFNYFIKKAKEANIIANIASVNTDGTTPPLTFSYSNFDFSIPFSTNIHLFNQSEIRGILRNELDPNDLTGIDLTYLYSNLPNPENPSEWNQLLGCYSEMVRIVKNSIYQPTPYRCIYSLLDHQPYNHHSGVIVVFLAYSITHNG